ncbi:MAG: ROK family protein [Clostridia bacterium]
MKTINLSDIKTVNFNTILECAISKREVAIADIAELTNLSIPTVRKSIDYGVGEGIFLSKELAESTGGRKATIYALNKDYFYSIYFVLDNLNLMVTLQNFAEETVYHASKKIVIGNIINEICLDFETLCKRYNNIKLMCVALPCMVENGVIKEWFYAPSYKDVNVQEIFENKYNIKVLIENDMKSSVSALVKDDEKSNISAVQFGHNGIGIGIVADGQILKGQNSFAGEIGYIDDINRNIMSVRYCAKIVRALICFCNPAEIVFYTSDRQNNIEKIVSVAMKYIPEYVRPQIVVSDNYLDDILDGLRKLSREERMIDVSNVRF